MLTTYHIAMHSMQYSYITGVCYRVQAIPAVKIIKSEELSTRWGDKVDRRKIARKK